MFWTKRPKFPLALRIPVYALTNKWEGDPAEGLSRAVLRRFASAYDPEVFEQIIAALRWSQANPSFDFTSLLPGIRYSNETILAYLRKLLEQLESLEVGAVSSDRPPTEPMT
jgi:hypothetical protein